MASNLWASCLGSPDIETPGQSQHIWLPYCPLKESLGSLLEIASTMCICTGTFLEITATKCVFDWFFSYVFDGFFSYVFYWFCQATLERILIMHWLKPLLVHVLPLSSVMDISQGPLKDHNWWNEYLLSGTLLDCLTQFSLGIPTMAIFSNGWDPGSCSILGAGCLIHPYLMLKAGRISGESHVFGPSSQAKETGFNSSVVSKWWQRQQQSRCTHK